MSYVAPKKVRRAEVRTRKEHHYTRWYTLYRVLRWLNWKGLTLRMVGKPMYAIVLVDLRTGERRVTGYGYLRMDDIIRMTATVNDAPPRA